VNSLCVFGFSCMETMRVNMSTSWVACSGLREEYFRRADLVQEI